MTCRLFMPLLAAAAAVWGASALHGESAPASPAATLADVPALIQQLGSSRFADRRRAEEQLLRLGPDAYDLLDQAADHPDPEVQQRLAYIKLCLQIDWVREDDPPPVRRLLHEYSALAVEARIETLAELAALPGGEGLAPLVRIARFESTDTVAQLAALTIVERDDAELRELGRLARAVEAESGAGSRPALLWIRNRLTSLDDAAAALVDLAPLQQTQLEPLLAADPHQQVADEHQGEVAFRLFRRYVRLAEQLDDEAALAACLAQVVQLDQQLPRVDDRYSLFFVFADASPRSRTLYFLLGQYLNLTDLDDGRGCAGLCMALDWALENRHWTVADRLAEQFDDLLTARRGPWYLWASVQAARGRADAAAIAADAAHELAVEMPHDQDMQERKYAADALADRGQIAWAMREYRHVIDESELDDYGAAFARESLAQWLHDDQQHGAASAVLAELCDTLREDEDLRKSFRENWRHYSISDRAYRSQWSGLQHYYAACQAEADGDPDEQRKQLELAVEFSEDNPDILIALYRLNADDAERQRHTVDRINRVARGMRRTIRDNEGEDAQLAQAYNQLAWLIGNTEGDFDEAVEMSLKSLELAPDTPSFLDTLGRCYYAAGDLDNAIAAQTRACEMTPHYQVMQRQLEFFKSQRAAANSAESD